MGWGQSTDKKDLLGVLDKSLDLDFLCVQRRCLGAVWMREVGVSGWEVTLHYIPTYISFFVFFFSPYLLVYPAFICRYSRFSFFSFRHDFFSSI